MSDGPRNFNSVFLFIFSFIGHNQVIVSKLATREVGIMTVPENIFKVEGEDLVLTCNVRNLGKRVIILHWKINLSV